jgi:cytochrome c
VSSHAATYVADLGDDMRRTLLCLGALLAAGPAVAADVARGQELYESRCIACHSLDANRVGPAHRGVYGRKAGTAPEFNYSNAVRNSVVVWDEATLDKWLTNPQSLIPGQRMNFRIAEAADRTDIIAFLKRESGK